MGTRFLGKGACQVLGLLHVIVSCHGPSQSQIVIPLSGCQLLDLVIPVPVQVLPTTLGTQQVCATTNQQLPTKADPKPDVRVVHAGAALIASRGTASQKGAYKLEEIEAWVSERVGPRRTDM